jgi:hypothetical protein
MSNLERIKNAINTINAGKDFHFESEIFDNELSKQLIHEDHFYSILKKLFSYCDKTVKDNLSFFYSLASHCSGVLQIDLGRINYAIIMHILDLSPEKEYLQFLELYFGDENEETDLKYAEYESVYFDTQVRIVGSNSFGGGLTSDVVPPVAYLLSLVDFYNVRLYNEAEIKETMLKLDKREKLNNYKLRKDFKKLFDLTIYEEMLVVKTRNTFDSWMK